MSTLLNIAIPAAGTVISPAYKVAEDEDFDTFACQANFTYGSGGTSADFYVQTTFDGTTWADMMHFRCLLANYRKLLNVSRRTSVLAVAAASDGTLANDSAVDGIVGNQFRVKYVIVGTYAVSSIRLDVNRRLRKAFAAP